MTRRIVVVLAAAVVATLGLTIAGSAHHADPQDGDDTGGRLDVGRVRTWGTAKPGWRLVTFERWRVRDIYDSGYALVFIDTFAKKRPDYYALVFVQPPAGNRLKAELFRDRQKRPDFKIADLKVWRKNRQSVSLVVPLREMKVGKQRTFFRWRAETLFTGPGCRSVCLDFVPDAERLVTEPFAPAPPPSPSPSPSPTILPTPSI